MHYYYSLFPSEWEHASVQVLNRKRANQDSNKHICIIGNINADIWSSCHIHSVLVSTSLARCSSGTALHWWSWWESEHPFLSRNYRCSSPALTLSAVYEQFPCSHPHCKVVLFIVECHHRFTGDSKKASSMHRSLAHQNAQHSVCTFT